MSEPDMTLLANPLTPAEERAVAAIAQGMTYDQAAGFLRVSRHTVIAAVKSAGSKIAGNLPLKRKVTEWYNGGETFGHNRRPF